MDRDFDVPDSTDWLATPLHGLARVESALRCQVCKDFYDNPVITTCCHTFCSLCIRRCLGAEGKCPTCRSPDQVLKLRRNWAVQELVDSFRASRRGVLEVARRAGDTTAVAAAAEEGGTGAEEPASKKRRVDASDTGSASGAAVPQTTDTARRTRSQSRKEGSRNASSQPIAVDNDDTEADGDEEYRPGMRQLDSGASTAVATLGLDDGLVGCPICGRRMRNEAVYFHLDRCTGSDPKPRSTEATGSLRFPSSRTTPSTTQPPPQRLPTINYSLLKENDLRRKLRELGIPDWGSKPLLQKRHTEWLNLWNANCDSKIPKSKRELLRELDLWERTQGGQAFGGGSGAVMRKNFDGSAWSATHGDEYKLLIADARRKRQATEGDAVEQGTPTENNSAGEDTTISTPNTRESNEYQEQKHPQQQTQPQSSSPPQPETAENNTENHAEDGDKIMEDTSPDDGNGKASECDKSLESKNQIIVIDDVVA